MKRILSLALACILLVSSVFVLASCSNVSEKYADKINEAAEAKEYYTYADVLEDLGDEAIDITVTVLGSTNGVVMAAKGCETKEDIEAKIDEGKEIEGITVVIINGKATSAKYGVITEDDLK